jgi:hypothetical protein
MNKEEVDPAGKKSFLCRVIFLPHSNIVHIEINGTFNIIPLSIYRKNYVLYDSMW